MVRSGTPSTILDRARLRRAGWSVALLAAAMCTPVVVHGQWLPWKKRAPKAQPAATRPADSTNARASGDSARAAAGDTTGAASGADTVSLPGIGVVVRTAQPGDTTRAADPIYIPRMPDPERAATRQAPPASEARPQAADTAAALPPPPAGPPAAQEPETPAVPADTTPRPGTHVVKKGDTLWDLARAYLSDPFQWPEIYRVNTDVVEDPHWIYPGERLRLPGGAAPRAVAATEEPEPMLSATIFNKADDDGPARAAPRTGRPMLTGAEPARAVRSGEVYSAPWVERRGGQGGRGRLIVAVGPSSVPASTERPRLQLFDRVYAALPAGAAARPGDRFVTVAEGPELGSESQLMVPTGVVRVERPGDGEAATVQIVAQYGEIRRGQALIPLQRFPIPADVQPAPRQLGMHSRVLWIPSGAVLPSLLHYVVLDARLRDGVVIGDQFTLVQTRTRSEDGDVLPEEPVALVQVVRVTERGTTAVVVGQRHPAIRQGMEARLTAKMP